jgi:hypothetical protein
MVTNDFQVRPDGFTKAMIPDSWVERAGKTKAGLLTGLFIYRELGIKKLPPGSKVEIRSQDATKYYGLEGRAFRHGLKALEAAHCVTYERAGHGVYRVRLINGKVMAWKKGNP